MASRHAQKNRTRAALLEAARHLMAEGAEITVARVADAANVSRATAYRYYSEPGALSTEATLDIELEPVADLLNGIDDPRARVHVVAHYYLAFARDHEGEMRQFLAETMRQWARQSGNPMRGARRVYAFSEALAPVRDLMAADAFQELTMRLSMLTGVEQHVLLSDVLAVTPEAGDRLQADIVDAVLDRYLPPSA